MERDYLTSVIQAYLAKQYCCVPEELEKKEVVYTINDQALSPYIKIMTYKECILVSTSRENHDQVKSALVGKSRDEIFEYPLVYGQTIHYVPNVKELSTSLLPDKYTYIVVEGPTLTEYVGLTDFPNSLGYDEKGRTSTVIALLAKDKNKIIAVAGASEVKPALWEVGIDVLREYRQGGLGTGMVRKLTKEIVDRGIVPFYSASVTNIGSQIVAAKSGYLPCWVDTYGNYK